MSRRAWVLFAAMAVIWGIPYLFIKIAVVEVSPPALAGMRTLLAALILLPLAWRQGALRPALAKWPYVVAFGVMDRILRAFEQLAEPGEAGGDTGPVDRTAAGRRYDLLEFAAHGRASVRPGTGAANRLGRIGRLCQWESASSTVVRKS